MSTFTTSGTFTLPGGASVDLPKSPFPRELVSMRAAFSVSADDMITLLWLDGEGEVTASVSFNVALGATGFISFGKHIPRSDEATPLSTSWLEAPIPVDIVIEENDVLRLTSTEGFVTFSNVKMRTRPAK